MPDYLATCGKAQMTTENFSNGDRVCSIILMERVVIRNLNS